MRNPKSCAHGESIIEESGGSLSIPADGPFSTLESEIGSAYRHRGAQYCPEVPILTGCHRGASDGTRDNPSEHAGDDDAIRSGPHLVAEQLRGGECECRPGDCLLS